jgi:serine protease Do
LVQRLKGVVVHIGTNDVSARRRSSLEHFFRTMRETTQLSQGTSLASGVIVSPDGYILTTNHTLPENVRLIVTLANRHSYTAQVIGRDHLLDLALLRITPSEPLPAAPFGESETLQVGEWVMALGNPFGLGYSATAGIVSAVGRVIGQSAYDDFIQTDAAVNPGNAGGPLVNMRGEVVGINTLLLRGAKHISFAVPSATARSIYDQLRETGVVARGFLGVTGQRLSEEVAAALRFPGDTGVLIIDVEPESAAAQAGLQRGDVILELAGEPARDPAQLGRRMASQPVGSRIDVLVWRDGVRRSFQVTVKALPVRAVPPDHARQRLLGLRLRDLTPELAQQLYISPQEGVLIEEVQHGSIAAQAGLQRGDVIVEVNRSPVSDVSQFQRLLEEAPRLLLVLVKRGSTTRYMTLPLG